jgi:hypothetical protein
MADMHAAVEICAYQLPNIAMKEGCRYGEQLDDSPTIVAAGEQATFSLFGVEQLGFCNKNDIF